MKTSTDNPTAEEEQREAEQAAEILMQMTNPEWVRPQVIDLDAHLAAEGLLALSTTFALRSRPLAPAHPAPIQSAPVQAPQVPPAAAPVAVAAVDTARPAVPVPAHFRGLDSQQQAQQIYRARLNSWSRYVLHLRPYKVRDARGRELGTLLFTQSELRGYLNTMRQRRENVN